MQTRHNLISNGMPVCALLVLCAAEGLAQPTATFTPLISFDGSANGSNTTCTGGMIQATNGDLYGTTCSGGENGTGTVFKMTPSGNLTTLYNFSDGARPMGPLVQATNGNLYGTASQGGTYSVGAIFKIGLSGANPETLYSFCPDAMTDCPDGATPIGGLVQATNGDFYGTTSARGANGQGGTVFKFTPGGKLTTLHAFCSQVNCTDGSGPTGTLIQANDGNLYGTTEYGGANSGNPVCLPGGCGTVFRITPTAKPTFTSLHSFCNVPNCADGANPYAGLIQGLNGNLYGTTYLGGIGSGAASYGTAFEMSLSGGPPIWTWPFCSLVGCADGAYPIDPLVQGSDGNLYGTTGECGGSANCAGYIGTIFTITPDGSDLTPLFAFPNCGQLPCPDGVGPMEGLIQDTNGTFYGMTSEGGNAPYPSGNGTIFSISTGLGPFVEPQTTSGAVGATVKILGTGLTKASSVTFNGTSATFTVVSSSEITATVPTGATSGPIQVVTPKATLSSNVPFQVQ